MLFASSPGIPGAAGQEVGNPSCLPFRRSVEISSISALLDQPRATMWFTQMGNRLPREVGVQNEPLPRLAWRNPTRLMLPPFAADDVSLVIRLIRGDNHDFLSKVRLARGRGGAHAS